MSDRVRDELDDVSDMLREKLGSETHFVLVAGKPDKDGVTMNVAVIANTAHEITMGLLQSAAKETSQLEHMFKAREGRGLNDSADEKKDKFDA